MHEHPCVFLREVSCVFVDKFFSACLRRTDITSRSALRIDVHRARQERDGVLDVEGLADVEGFARGHSDERADVAPAMFELLQKTLLADARERLLRGGVVELRAVREYCAHLV